MPRKKFRRLDRATAAAWVLRANPRVFDVEGTIAEGAPPSTWRLASNYRVRLIAIDDPVVLWLSGPSAGIVAVGAVTGLPRENQGKSPFWLDADEKSKVRPYVPVHLIPIPKISKADLLVDSRFAEAEIIRAPRVANPSFLTAGELQAAVNQMNEFIVQQVGWG